MTAPNPSLKPESPERMPAPTATPSLTEVTAKTPPDHALGLATVPEIRELVPLPVTGTLPAYLSESTLYRVGPGRYDAHHSDGAPFSITHWFDGLSLLHAFSIDASRNSVHYRNRFLTDSLVRTIESVPRSKWNRFSFGPSDPCRSLLGRFFHLWTKELIDPVTSKPPSMNVGVTVQTVPGKGVTIRTDSPYNAALNEDQLEIDHFFKFSDIDESLSGVMSSAHAHFDPATGEFFNYVYTLGGSGGPTPYTVFKIRPDGTSEVLAVVREPPSYLHSFAVTERYFVLIVWPMRVNPLSVLFNKSVLDGAAFQPDAPARFVVVSREGDGVVATFEADAFFCFHTVNAYEEPDGDVVIDLCRYADDAILHDFELDQFRTKTRFARSTLTRFHLEGVRDSAPPSSSASAKTTPAGGDVKRAREVVVNEFDIELPRINPEYRQRAHRYVYGVSSENGVFDSVAKIDTKDGGRRVIWRDARSVCGEPIFVPDPDGAEEDDGCILVVVLDAAVRTSELVVLDAKSMTRIASAKVPQIVPLGFHGMLREKGVDHGNPVVPSRV